MLVRHRPVGAVALAILTAGVVALPAAAQDPAGLALAPIATLSLGAFDEGATEIIAYDPTSRTVFSVNGETDALDLIDLTDPTAPTLTMSVALPGSPTSVDVANGVVAVAVLAEEDSTPGQVVFLDTAGAQLGSVTVGAHPDDVTFTPDGLKVLTADEGEPSGDYSVDGEGSATIVDLAAGPENATATVVGFADFNEGGPRAGELPAGLRIYGPNASVAQDLEPEFVVVSPDGQTAYVSLQENNALAIVDIPSATVTAIVDLGLKDFSIEGNGIDPSDADGGITIAPIPAYGLYMPDQLGIVEVDGARYLVSANEGDTRDYEDVFSEESEVGEMDLDPTAFPDAAALQAEGAIGKLETTLASGDTDGDGDYDQLVATGGRSISVWDAATGQVVWDSGDLMERTIAELDPDNFNSTNDE
jgi:DNA-binding beta-propeller fold protein YncE